jgi:hypothetical protein
VLSGGLLASGRKFIIRGMARSSRHSFVGAELEPSWTPSGVDRERRIEEMRQLRGLSNSIASAYLARDDRILAVAPR